MGGGGQRIYLRGRHGHAPMVDGTPHPWEFKRVWHLKPSPDDPDTVYAGVEDAALFCSNDGGHGWRTRSTRVAFTSERRADRCTASADAGDTWEVIAEYLPRVSSVEVQTLP